MDYTKEISAAQSDAIVREARLESMRKRAQDFQPLHPETPHLERVDILDPLEFLKLKCAQRDEDLRTEQRNNSVLRHELQQALLIIKQLEMTIQQLRQRKLPPARDRPNPSRDEVA